MPDSLGLYLSIPFCRAKCTFCNFASDSFAPSRLPLYVRHISAEIASVRTRFAHLDADLPQHVDTVYLGGGTPSLLSPPDVHRIFSHLRRQFTLAPNAEITVECAPGQLSPETLDQLLLEGVNRLSFGIQSFVDRESAAIGRLHTAAQCLAEIDRVRRAGILNLSLDLIAGLPHQTEASWRHSVEQAIATGVPHLSVYMLEVDDESRLGREILALGSRYNAPAVPTDDDSVAFYELACHLLEDAGIPQYEISNFARPGFPSTHNLKYWQRKPYLGFGLDAHSTLGTPKGEIRLSNTDDLEAYLAQPRSEAEKAHAGGTERGARLWTGTRTELGTGIMTELESARESRTKDHSASREANPLPLLHQTVAPGPIHRLTRDEAFEETIFLGLRTNAGLSLEALRHDFGTHPVDLLAPALTEAAADGLLLLDHDNLRLTPRGRTLSNEVFSRLLLPTPA